MGKNYKNMLARMLVYMYALKGGGLFYKAGLKTSASHDTDTTIGPNTHHPKIYSVMKCNPDLVKRNGGKE